MNNKNFLLLFIFLQFCSIQTIFAQATVQWASKVLGVSSQYLNLDKPQSNQFQADQILGKPDKLPAFGESPCAWSPASSNNPEGEWIKVGFDVAMKIQQIVIAENYNPGAVSDIFAYDAADKEYLIYKNVNVGPLVAKGRLFTINQKTDFEVKAIKLFLRTDKVPGYNQLDAVAISNSTEPIEIKINVANKDNKLSIKTKPENLGININSAYQEIAPIISPDGKTLYFTRSKHPQNIGSPDKQDVWFAEMQKDSTFGEARNIGPPINTHHHNSNFSISPDGNTMLLNNVYNRDSTSEGGVSLEKGLSITRKDKNSNWSAPQKVVIQDYYNRDKYSEFCLSQDGKILLMTIQRNDSRGGKDIYFSRIKPDGTWTTPDNLGSVVNTVASETSPFLASDGKTLYYSTSGFSGYGANDIFVTRRLDETWKSWSEPLNLGPEINTPEWDAYFSISASTDYAYFTSYYNSMGESDIFRVKLPKEVTPDPVALIRGKVFNAKTKEPIKANIIYEILPEGQNAGNAVSNAQTGDYKVVLPLKKNYGILADAKGFLSVDENIDLSAVSEYKEIIKDLYLVPIAKDGVFTLNNIYFEPTKFSLLSASFPELNRLSKALKENSTLEIRLEGHTEVFGKKKEQYELAENRVKSVKRYLVDNGGIDAKRIKLKSYGGSRPKSQGTSDEERASNRRVEVRIIKQ